MSHLRRADRQATEIDPEPAAHCLTTSYPGATARYIPLAQRTAEQLLANSAHLRRMAATASTTDVAKALLDLADRYAARAARGQDAQNS